MKAFAGMCSVMAVLVGVLSAGWAAAEENVWDKRREVGNVFQAARKLNEAIHRYARGADKLPSDASDLTTIYNRAFYPAEFPRLPLAWHGKPVFIRAYRDDPAKVVTLRQEEGRAVSFTLNLDALKDTAQLMYVTGEASVGGGPKRPYAVIWFDCTHDKGEFDVRMCAGGVIKTSFGRSRRTGWMPIMETERFRVENQEPTEEHLKQIRGAAWVFYQDSKGPSNDSFYPPSLDHLVPLFLGKVPAKRHLTYDSLDGALGIRKK